MIEDGLIGSTRMRALDAPLPHGGAVTIQLLALALAASAIGTSEFLIVGLLPEVARDVRATVPSAGLLVTGYALGVVIGAPVLAIAAARAPRKGALLVLIGGYTAGNVLCAVSPDYALLMAARVLTATCHGAFFGIGSIVAADLVSPAKRSQAISMMFSGLTLANVLGVPVGTALGQVAGWRVAFWCVAVVALLATAAIARTVPRLPPPQPSRLVAELAVLRGPRVILAMAMSGLLSASLFSVFTFVIPLLEDVTRVRAVNVTWLLLLFGAGTVIGNLVGGRLGDWKLLVGIAGTQLGLIIIFVILAFVASDPLPTTLVLLAWGALTYANAAPMQLRVIDTAPGAPNLVATLNQGAFNLGNAAGAWLGSVALGMGLAYHSLPWLGVTLCVAGLLATTTSVILDRRGIPGRP